MHLTFQGFFFKSKKVVLGGTNNLLLESPKDIANDILETASLFKTNYSCVNVVICGVLPCGTVGL